MKRWVGLFQLHQFLMQPGRLQLKSGTRLWCAFVVSSSGSESLQLCTQYCLEYAEYESQDVSMELATRIAEVVNKLILSSFALPWWQLPHNNNRVWFSSTQYLCICSISGSRLCSQRGLSIQLVGQVFIEFYFTYHQLPSSAQLESPYIRMRGHLSIRRSRTGACFSLSGFLSVKQSEVSVHSLTSQIVRRL